MGFLQAEWLRDEKTALEASKTDQQGTDLFSLHNRQMTDRFYKKEYVCVWPFSG